jgi:hypothetical protein
VLKLLSYGRLQLTSGEKDDYADEAMGLGGGVLRLRNVSDCSFYELGLSADNGDALIPISSN